MSRNIKIYNQLSIINNWFDLKTLNGLPFFDKTVKMIRGMISWKQIFSATLLSLIVVLVGSTGKVTAAQSCSGSYCVDQTVFGSGSELNACSTNYCSKQSAGELTVGNTSSANYQAQAGNNTDRQPYLQLIVNNANLDLGVLTTTTTKTASATFSVKSYLAGGYVVVNASPPPQNGGNTINALTTPTASSTGTEQFGINLVANSCPTNNPTSGPGGCSGGLGANPVQVPDNTFSYGQVASGYNTPNLFKYVNGDAIASSSKSSGETDYTISYLFNINDITAGGTFTMNHVLVATATF